MNRYVVKNEDIGLRLDKFLATLLNLSRTKIQSLFEENKVLVDGKVVKESLKLKEGMVIETAEYEPIDTTIKPENIDLDIRYEDDDVVVINKPIGMVVHPANGHYEGTLVNSLIYHFQNLANASSNIRPGIVHRIDKETSGLLMVAKNDYALESLSKQLKDKTAYRRYIALIHGELPHKEATIIAPIGRNKSDRKKMTITSSGKESTTHIKVLERFPNYTLVECLLETGRTHQIRVHLNYIKFPIVGDIIYGPKKVAYPYQLLHATTLAFIHPRTNKEVKVEAPLPDYFEKALENLRKFGALKEEEK